MKLTRLAAAPEALDKVPRPVLGGQEGSIPVANGANEQPITGVRSRHQWASVPPLIVAGLCLLCPTPAHAKQWRQAAGRWIAIVESEPADCLRCRAIPYHQRVFRQGPGDRDSVLLYERTSAGPLDIRLREDGALLVLPGAVLFFPTSVAPVVLHLPPPRKWRGPGEPYSTLEVDTTWFVGDFLFYSRLATPGHRLMGFLRIDSTTRTLAESTLCLEVAEDEQTVAEAARPMPIVFRVADHVLWVNEGYYNDWYPELVKGEWKSRKVRALSLKTGRLVDPDTLLEAVRQNKEQVLDFLEKQAHNRSPELEIWAVGLLGRCGEPADADRLEALSRSVKHTHMETAPNRIGSAEESVHAAYAAALDAVRHAASRPTTR